MKKGYKTIVIYLVLVIGIYFLISSLTGGALGLNNSAKTKEINYSKLVQHVEAGNVNEIVIDKNWLIWWDLR